MFDYFFRPGVLVRQRGSMHHDDVICPQAFGRNTWTDEEVAGKLSDLFQEGPAAWQKLDDLARFRKLESVGFDPGEVNRQLAKYCYELSYRDNTLPQTIVGQWEVLYAVYQINPLWYINIWCNHHAIWPPVDGNYLSTRGLLEEVFEKISSRKRVRLVAQSVHLARCVRLADKIFGQERVVVPGSSLPLYDWQSVQPWTRDQASFFTYEKKARALEELPGFLRNIIRKVIQK